MQIVMRAMSCAAPGPVSLHCGHHRTELLRAAAQRGECTGVAQRQDPGGVHVHGLRGGLGGAQGRTSVGVSTAHPP